jgi:DNA-binding LytR/AlgR family response regulator
LYEKEGSMEFYGNLNSISDQLGPSFARPHRSFLVNQAHIIEVDAKNQTVVLDNGKTCKTRR